MRNDGLHLKRDGLYYFYIPRALATDGRAGHTRCTGTADYSEARRRRELELEKLRQGKAPTELADWTLERAAVYFFSDREADAIQGGRSGKTVKSERQIFKPVVAALGGLRLRELVGWRIVAYRNQRKRAVGPRTLKYEMALLAMMLRCARLEREDVKEALIIRHAPRSDRGHRLTPEEEQRLWAALGKVGREAGMFAAKIARFSGLRHGEVVTLQLCDLSLDPPGVTVRRVKTKTDAGARQVPLNAEALWAVNRALDRVHKLCCRGEGTVGQMMRAHPMWFLFPADGSRHTHGVASPAASNGIDPTRHQENVRSAWESAREDAAHDCPPVKLSQRGRATRPECKCAERWPELARLRFHDLRHTRISEFAVAGVPLAVAMATFGHNSPEVHRIYQHVLGPEKSAAMAQVDAMVADNK